jgi:hypothetical protein
VHRKTRRHVIERELLFDVGDPYDPALLRETERNLRTLPFLRRVEIVGIDTSSGAVVIVRTWDAWTLELVGNFSRAGGVTNASGGASDNNILGFGKSGGFLYSENGSVVSRSLSYSDPQLFGRRHFVGSAKAQQSNDDGDYEVVFGRPFYASIARWSLTGGGKYIDSHQTAFQGPLQAGEVGRKRYEAFTEYGYALEARPRRAQRVRARLQYRKDDFRGLTGVSDLAAFVPEADRHAGIVAAYDYQEINYIKQKRIQKLSREEDFNLGLAFLPAVEYDPRWSAVGATGEKIIPGAEIHKGFASELGHFVFLKSVYTSTYVNGRAGNTVAQFDAQYFCRYFPRHTVAAHAQFDRGWRLDFPTLLRLGEDNGLRGYRSQQFQGDRRLLFNVEERMFWGEDILHLFDAGGVVFFDSGYVWMPQQKFSMGDMHSSYGFGLRLGATRSANNVPVRIDVAHALNDNNFPTRWTVSFQAGAAFGPN